MAKITKDRQADALLKDVVEKLAPGFDSEALSEELAVKHGTMATLFETHERDLVDGDGLPKTLAHFISIVPQVARYVRTEQALPPGRLMNSFERCGGYMAARYVGVLHEQVYVMCLDNNFRMTACELLLEGTIDRAPFYLRSIFECALRHKARNIVISHNHPAGTPSPSPGDISNTVKALEHIQRLDVVLLDHIIVADGKPYSMWIGNDSLKPRFLRQDRMNHVLQNWGSEKAKK